MMFTRVRRRFFSDASSPDCSDREFLSSSASSGGETECTEDTHAHTCSSSIWSGLPSFKEGISYCYPLEDVRSRAVALTKRQGRLLRPIGVVLDWYVPKKIIAMTSYSIGTATNVSKRTIQTGVRMATFTVMVPVKVCKAVGRQVARPLYPIGRLVNRTAVKVHGLAISTAAVTSRVFYASLRVTRLNTLGEKYGKLLRLLRKIAATRRDEVMPVVINMAHEILSIPQEDVTLMDLMSATRMYEDFQKKSELFKPTLGQHITNHNLPMISRYIRYAIAAYGRVTLQALGCIPMMKLNEVTDNDQAAAVVAGISRQEIVASSWTGSACNPAWFISLDHETACVIVAFRGTSCVKEVIADLACEGLCCSFPGLSTLESPDGNGYAHRGFYETAEKIAKELQATIEKVLSNHPNYQIVLTGHALGAAVASLVCLFWIPIFSQVHCYSYEQPCLLSKQLCVAARPYITAVLCADDMSPRFELGSVLDLREIMLWVSGLKPLCLDPKPILDPANEADKDAFVGTLYPPGRLFYLHPNSVNETRDGVTFDEYKRSEDLSPSAKPSAPSTDSLSVNSRVEYLMSQEHGIVVRVRLQTGNKPLLVDGRASLKEITNSPSAGAVEIASTVEGK